MSNLPFFLATIAIVASIAANGPSDDGRPTAIAFAQWTPHPEAKFVVDVTDNTGYLIRPDGVFTRFRVVTGQRRVVRYIGRTYFAGTPERSWTVQTEHVKGDRITFGPRGLFLRLYAGEEAEYSPYGIHGHRSAEVMLAGDDAERYRSMGCIIVDEEVLSLLQSMFHAYGTLTVETRNSPPWEFGVVRA